MNSLSYHLECDRNALLKLLKEIVSLADIEKNAVGFWPESAIKEAIIRNRLWALCVGPAEHRELIGYIHYSGIYPHAKVQQIAVCQGYRRCGAASAMLGALVSRLEQQSYLTLKAEIASDLAGSLKFYQSNRFVEVATREGGKSRKRSIAIHVRELDTDSLFSHTERITEARFDIGIRRRAYGDNPIYAFDLNVYFDLVRDRSKSNEARNLFAAALAHTIRLTVADEFVNELKKTSKTRSNDPILQMALQLPRLPKPDKRELATLRDRIHKIIFEDIDHPAAGSSQSISDAGHLAHAALTHASAFITRDSALLDARVQLLNEFGIDVIGLEELVALLPVELDRLAEAARTGNGFQFGDGDEPEVDTYFRKVGIPKAITTQFHKSASFGRERIIKVIRDGPTILALGILLVPKDIRPVASIFVHVQPEQPNSSMFVDFLLDHLIRQACIGLPVAVELCHVPGQSTLHSLAKSRGFVKSQSEDIYTKVAIGKPLTADNWASVARELRMKTGLVLPEEMPDIDSGADGITIANEIGDKNELDVLQLENFLSPTMIIWPTRGGVVVPIAHSYANELLGTGKQQNFPFLEDKDAAFFSRRAYVSTPRNAGMMRSETPIFFYESSGTGGLGAVVAVARIVDSVVAAKSNLPHDGKKRLVVDDVSEFSASDDVLLTTFESLLTFPNPVSFKYMKQIGATGGTNIVSAVQLSGDKVLKILNKGWEDDATK